MEFQGQLFTCPRLLCQPLLQLLLLLQQLVDLLVVVEGLPHQLSLGQPGMFELSGGEEQRDRVTEEAERSSHSISLEKDGLKMIILNLEE